MSIEFKKATKQQSFLRMALQGPSGAGKTRTALEIAKHVVTGDKRIALVDTERGSASKYSHLIDFDVLEVNGDYHPSKVVEAVYAAADAGYGAVVVDSMTHFWNGPGGFLDLVDGEVKKMQYRGAKSDSYAAWKVVDPIYQRMIQKLMTAPIDWILTMRAKQEYERGQDERGKTVIKRLGLAPEMRDNFVYEADIEGMIDMDHNLVIGKNRFDGLDGKVFHKAGKEVADILRAWLSDGAPVVAKVDSAKVERDQYLKDIIDMFDLATTVESVNAASEKAKELLLTAEERPAMIRVRDIALKRIESEQ